MTINQFASWYGNGWSKFLRGKGVKWRKRTERLEPILAHTLMDFASGKVG